VHCVSSVGQAGHVTPDVRRFLAEIRLQPNFAEIAADPRKLADFELYESALDRIYVAGAEDGDAVELFDAVRRIVSRDDTIKVRMLAIQSLMIRARVGQQ
jgi:hypothetical protein